MEPRHLDPPRWSIPLMLVLLVAACGGGAVGSTVSSAPTPSPPGATGTAVATPSPSAIATPEPTPAVTVHQLSFDLDGDTRPVPVYVPEPAPAERVPLVVFLHAAGDTPEIAVRDTRFDRLAGSEGFIAAFPPAANRAWDVQVTPGLSDGPTDERWIAALIDHLLDAFPVDASRVYVAGFSFGAVMADRLACQHADRLAAVAVVSGATWIGAACSPSRPVSMLIIHGTADSTFGLGGGRQLADAWLAIDRCAPPGTPAPIGDGVERLESGGCADGTAVRFISVAGGWHTWFTEPDATQLAWEFFAEHRR